MPKLDTHKSRMEEMVINNTDILNSIPTYFQECDSSVKRWEWETVESFPNSKLRYKIPKDVKEKWNKMNTQTTGLFKVDIRNTTRLFTVEDIRSACAKHFKDKVILDICKSPKEFDDFIRWSINCKNDEASGIEAGLYCSTAHAAHIYGVEYPNKSEYINKSVLPPKRKKINELKKYITIYSLNRIPIVTKNIIQNGIISLYECSDGKETDSIRNTSFHFYNIIKEQAEYLRVVPPRDGSRVYVVGTCDFKK